MGHVKIDYNMQVKKGSVVLFKSPKEGVTEDPYVTVLREAGMSAKCHAALGFEYINLDNIYEAMTHPERYSSLLITSQNGVRGIQCAIEKHSSIQEWKDKYLTEWKKLPSFVVGPATSDAARNLGLKTVGEETGNGELLFPTIQATLSKGCKPTLYPCGNLSREVIPVKMAEAGLELADITVYVTGSAMDITEHLTSAVQSQDCPEYIVYYSPSGINYTYEALVKLGFPLAHIKFVAIGPTTEQALLSRGITPAATADKPTPVCVLHAIQSTMLSP